MIQTKTIIITIIIIIKNSKNAKSEQQTIATVVTAGQNTALLNLDKLKNFVKIKIASYRYWSGNLRNKQSLMNQIRFKNYQSNSLKSDFKIVFVNKLTGNRELYSINFAINTYMHQIHKYTCNYTVYIHAYVHRPFFIYFFFIVPCLSLLLIVHDSKLYFDAQASIKYRAGNCQVNLSLVYE